MLREMATTYGRSALGYIWAVAEPVAGIMLMSLIFSLAFRAPPLGTNFPIFYATGYLPFVMYMDISAKMAVSIRFNKPLLFYPGVTFVDALLARFLLNALTQVMVVYVVLGALVLAYDPDVSFAFDWIMLSLLGAAILGVGVGTLNCFMFSYFPSYERLWAVVNRPMFIVSGIFFTFESVPQPFRDWLWWNPLVHIIGMMRRGFYSYYEAPYVSLVYVYGLGLLLMLVGLALLRRHYREFINS